MSRQSTFLVASIVGLFALVAAGPTLVALVDAAVPLVIAVGVVVLLVRIAWHLTDHR